MVQIPDFGREIEKLVPEKYDGTMYDYLLDIPNLEFDIPPPAMRLCLDEDVYIYPEDTYLGTANAIGVDPETVTYSLFGSAPDGVVIDPVTGVITRTVGTTPRLFKLIVTAVSSSAINIVAATTTIHIKVVTALQEYVPPSLPPVITLVGGSSVSESQYRTERVVAIRGVGSYIGTEAYKTILSSIEFYDVDGNLVPITIIGGYVDNVSDSPELAFDSDVNTVGSISNHGTLAVVGFYCLTSHYLPIVRASITSPTVVAGTQTPPTSVEISYKDFPLGAYIQNPSIIQESDYTVVSPEVATSWTLGEQKEFVFTASIPQLAPSYVELGYSANDAVDGIVTDDVIVSGDVVNLAVPAEYTVTYSVTNSKGMTTSVDRVVNVVPYTVPHLE